jgi:protein-L-isoaspartate O-methyltransferase
VRQLNNALRDAEPGSNIIERFDELTKLLYCRQMAARLDPRPEGAKLLLSGRSLNEDAECAAKAVRSFYAQLVARNEPLFPERFRELRLSSTTIARCVEALASINLDMYSDDVKGLAYEETIKNTFDKGDNQQFFTPRHVVSFMCELLADEIKGRVCDPACGTGGFLLGALHQAAAHNETLALAGFEIDERLAWATRMNLLMHGAKDFDVRCLPGGGSLDVGLSGVYGTIDVILTNPPFGSSVTAPDVLEQLELGRGRKSRRRGVLFVERCLDLLKPGGTVAIILDDGVLNGPVNKDVRELILRRSTVEAVVSVPETAFMPYASVKTSILVLRKHRPRDKRRPGTTFFARAEEVGRRQNGEPLVRAASGHVSELDSDLPQILTQWRMRHVAGANDGWSSPEARWEVFESALPSLEARDFAKHGYRLDLLFNHPSRVLVHKRLATSPYPVLTLNEIAEARRETVMPSTELGGELVPYVGLADIEAYTGRVAPETVDTGRLRSSTQRFRAGDILFSKMRPELRKVCLIPAEIEEGIASSECIVLVPRRHDGAWVMLPDLLAALLRTDLSYGQLIHTVTGIGRPRVSRATVLSLRFPVPPPAKQEEILRLYGRTTQAAEQLEREGTAALGRARAMMHTAGKLLMNDTTGEGGGHELAFPNG